MKTRRNIIIGITLSVLFLWVALRGLDWQAVGDVLRDARWQFVLVATVVWTLGLFTRAIRWRVLLGEQIALRPTFHILNIGFFLNNTIPLRIGELARAYLVGVSEPSISGWSALSTIVVERIIDMLAVVIMLVLVLPVIAVEGSAVTAAIIMGSIAIVGFLVLLVFAHRPTWAHSILTFFMNYLPFLRRLKLDHLITRLLDGLQPLTTWRGLFGAVFWTAASWFASAAGAWVLALVFEDIPTTATMRAALTLSIVAASFSIIIPFTIASVGPFEAAAIYALITVSISQEVATAYAVVWHSGVILVYTLWGIMGMWGLGVSFTEIRSGAASMEAAQPSNETP